jgi:hypothetical protein
MAMALLLAGADLDQPVVGPAAAAALAGLGITRVALFQDSGSIAVVLEGWAFDPTSCDEAARTVFPDDAARVRLLREVEQLAVLTAPQNGGST